MKNEWKAIKTLLQQSCCKKKWLVSAAFICLGSVWKIFSLSGRPEVAEDLSPLFFAVAGIMPMEMLLVNDISGFVKSSVLRKKIQTTMVTKSMFAGTMVAYLLYLAFLMILGSVREGQPEVYLRAALVYGVVVCFFGIGNVFLYKFFWAAQAGIYVICFCVGFAMEFFEDQIDFALTNRNVVSINKMSLAFTIPDSYMKYLSKKIVFIVSPIQNLIAILRIGSTTK